MNKKLPPRECATREARPPIIFRQNKKRITVPQALTTYRSRRVCVRGCVRVRRSDADVAATSASPPAHTPAWVGVLGAAFPGAPFPRVHRECVNVAESVSLPPPRSRPCRAPSRLTAVRGFVPRTPLRSCSNSSRKRAFVVYDCESRIRFGVLKNGQKNL